MIPATTLLQRPQSLALLASLPSSCATLWKYFLLLSETPRPSHHHGPLTAAMQKVASLLNVSLEIDAHFNYLFRIPATPGFEHVPPLVIQNHGDMVATNTVPHTWTTDPVNVTYDGTTYLRAQGTTLGSDNGIGVAASLALLEHCVAARQSSQLSNTNAATPVDAETAVRHGPLEVLVTANEETDMSGAENLQPGWVKAAAMFNLDSEDEGALCIGCAGGCYHKLVLGIPVSSNDSQAQRMCSTVQVNISGYPGGHTGIEIHRTIPNALKLVAEALLRLEASEQSGRLTLLTLDGGNAMNAIPQACSLTFAVSNGDDANVTKAMIQEVFRSVCADHVTFTDGEAAVMAQPSSAIAKVGALMRAAPHGVLTWDATVKELPETSTSLSLAKLENSVFTVQFFSRTSSNTGIDFAHNLFVDLSQKHNAQYDGYTDFFPGWAPNPHSRALKVLQETHERVLGQVPRIYAVHAGLECGWMQKAYPGIDCISFGPQIDGAHTVEERCNVPSVERFWKLLLAAVDAWAVQNSPQA